MNGQEGPGDRLGNLIIGGFLAWLGWQAIGNEGRQKIKTFLGDLGRGVAQVAAEQERHRDQAAMRDAIEKVLAALSQPKALPASQPDGPQPTTFPQAIRSEEPKPVLTPAPDGSWRKVMLHPSVVLILGKRGSGKSALGYRLLELFRYVAQPHVVGVPASARKLLPDWIGIASTLEDVTPKSVALVARRTWPTTPGPAAQPRPGACPSS